MLQVGKVHFMPNPLLQGVSKCNTPIIFVLLNLLGLSQRKTIENTKSYSMHLGPMEIRFDYARTSTFVGI